MRLSNLNEKNRIWNIELRRKKRKDKAYSTLIQKSKGSIAFDEQKVKNIAIEYRLQSIFPNPGVGSVVCANGFNDDVVA